MAEADPKRADPRWERLLVPVWDQAVARLASLIKGFILDALLSCRLITVDWYERFRSTRNDDDEAARQLLLHLKRKPDPSFDQFLAVLGKTDGGGHVLQLLCYDTPPLSPQSEQAARDCEKILIVIEVTESLREHYELHKRAMNDFTRRYLELAYPGKRIELSENVTELAWRETPKFAICSRPKMRILFPRSDSASFDNYRENIVTYLCRLMELKKDEFEVGITEGSITLQLHVPGRGLINMLNRLEQNANSLKFLLDVDALAKLSFGEFPYVSVSLLGKKSLQRATVESTEILPQVSPSVKQPHESLCLESPCRESTEMGSAISVPVLSELLTAGKSLCKVIGARVAVLVGDEEAAEELMDSAVKEWVDYSKRLPIAAGINIAIRRGKADKEGARAVAEKLAKSVEDTVDSAPVLGHIKGVGHYVAGDIDGGDKCMKEASKSLVVTGVSAATAGTGAVVVGSLAVTSSAAMDVVVTTCDSAAHRE